MKRISGFSLGIVLLFFYSLAFSQSQPSLSSATQSLNKAAQLIKAGHRLSPEQDQTINELAQVRQKLFAEEVNQAREISQDVLTKVSLDLLPRAAQPYLEKEIGPLTGTLE